MFEKAPRGHQAEQIEAIPRRVRDGLGASFQMVEVRGKTGHRNLTSDLRLGQHGPPATLHLIWTEFLLRYPADFVIEIAVLDLSKPMETPKALLFARREHHNGLRNPRVITPLSRLR